MIKEQVAVLNADVRDPIFTQMLIKSLLTNARFDRLRGDRETSGHGAFGNMQGHGRSSFVKPIRSNSLGASKVRRLQLSDTNTKLAIPSWQHRDPRKTNNKETILTVINLGVE